MFIDEKELSMMNNDDRKQIEQAMQQYLFEGIEPEIEGYKPPSE